MSEQKKNVKKLSIAMQGGGAHGAFTWGVLDRLLEEKDIVVEIHAEEVAKRTHRAKAHQDGEGDGEDAEGTKSDADGGAAAFLQEEDHAEEPKHHQDEEIHGNQELGPKDHAHEHAHEEHFKGRKHPPVLGEFQEL